jgi:tetratricopeptide (TPR) repeat protein
MALKANPEYVFPYRTGTLDVLEWASEQRPAWITDYYSALILWNRDRDTEAMNLLSIWGDEPDFVPFYYSRACLAGLKSDAALKDMQMALSVDPDQWRMYRVLADIHSQRGDNASALALTTEGHEKFPGNYILDLSYSKFLTINGDFEQSLEVLRDINVLPFEGENTGHDLYEYNNLRLAYEAYKTGDYAAALEYVDISEEYPENLGSGSPSYPDYRDQNQLRVMIYDKTGDAVKSREAQEKIQEYTERFGNRRGRSFFDQQFSSTVIQPF